MTLNKKVKLSVEDEEKLIDFVKSNEVLYCVKHNKFRDTEHKNRLWLELANELSMDVNVVKKKWVAMRDYFVKYNGKKPTGSAAQAPSKRYESLSFLLQTSILKKKSLSSMQSTSTAAADAAAAFIFDESTESPTDEEYLLETSSVNSPSVKDVCSDPLGSSSKKRKASHMEEILCEFLKDRPKPAVFLPQNPPDAAQSFCDSLAITLRQFDRLRFAPVKMKMNQLVGEEEMSWAAEQNDNVPFVYLDEVAQVQQSKTENFICDSYECDEQ